MDSFKTGRTHKRQIGVYSQKQRREEALSKLREERAKRCDASRRVQLDEIEKTSHEVWSRQEEKALNDGFAQGMRLEETSSLSDASNRQRDADAKHTLMQPLWMIEPPPDLATKWLVRARPEGKRCLVTASNSRTVSRSKNGCVLHSAFSDLPGGASPTGGPTLLDCIYHEPDETYYIMDLLCWNGVWVEDCEAAFRLHWVHSKLQECQPLSPDTPFQFDDVPFYACDRTGLVAALYDFVPFVRDGVSLLYSAGSYTPGPNANGIPLERQCVVLRLGDDGGLYTGDDPPICFSEMASCSSSALKNPAQLKPAQLIKFEILDGVSVGAQLEFVGFSKKRVRAADLFSKIRFQKYAREGQIQSFELIQAVDAQKSEAALNDS